MKTKQAVYHTKYIPIYFTSENSTTNPVTPLEISSVSPYTNDQPSLKQQFSYSDGLYLKTYETLSHYIRHNKSGLKFRGQMIYEQFSINEFLQKRNKSLEKFLIQLKPNNVKYLRPGSKNYLDENIILTPMPYKNRQLIQTNREANEYLNAERRAVSLRTFEYTHGLRSEEMNNEMKAHMEHIISDAAQTIQSWWKYGIKSTNAKSQRKQKGNPDQNHHYYSTNNKQCKTNSNKMKNKQLLHFFKAIDNIVNKRKLLSKKEFVDRLRYPITSSNNFNKKTPSNKVNTNKTNSQIGNKKKKRAMLFMFIIESRDRFSLNKPLSIQNPIPINIPHKQRNYSIKNASSFKAPKDIKKMKPIFGIETTNDFTLANNNPSFHHNPIRIIKPFHSKHGSISQSKANNKMDLIAYREYQIQQDLNKGRCHKNKIDKSITHSFIPNNNSHSINNSQSTINNNGKNKLIQTTYQITILQEQKPFKINQYPNQSPITDIHHPLQIENVTEKSFRSFLLFPEPLNVTQSMSDIKQLSRNNSCLLKKIYSINKIILIQKQFKAHLNRNNNNMRRSVALKERALLMRTILAKVNLIEKQIKTRLLLSSLYHWRTGNKMNTVIGITDNRGIDYIPFAFMLNSILKNKRRIVLYYSLNKLSNHKQWALNKKTNNQTVITSHKLSLRKIINRLNERKELKNKMHYYFNRWTNITSRSKCLTLSKQKPNHNPNLKIKSFSYLIKSSPNSNENDIRSLKILLLSQKIKKSIMRRKHSFLKLLYTQHTKKSFKPMNNSNNYSKGNYTYDLTSSLTNINEGIEKINAFIQRNKNHFFSRIVLMYLIANKININNEPIISLIKYGCVEKATFSKTLNEILKQNITDNTYKSFKSPFNFADFIKKLLSLSNENKSFTFIKKVSPVKKFENNESKSEDELDKAIVKAKQNQKIILQTKTGPNVSPLAMTKDLNVINTKNQTTDPNVKLNDSELLPSGTKSSYSLLHTHSNRNANVILLREVRDQKDIV